VTARELLYALWARGAILEPEAGRLRCRYPSGKVPDELKAKAAELRNELLALLGAPVEAVPPCGARLFVQDARGLPCRLEVATSWCWERGPQWYAVSKRPLPPVRMTLSPRSGVRCKACKERKLVLTLHEFKNGSKHYRCDCGLCGRHVKYLKPPPWDNPDIELWVAD
jgi:hypothetical protein